MRRQVEGHPKGRPARKPTSILRDPKKGLTRREWMSLVGGGVLLGSLMLVFGRVGRGLRPGVVPVVMYTWETCDCCHLWVAHLEANGYRVDIRYLSDVTHQKDTLGVPAQLRACHTAEVSGVVVEGHVPADILTRFLTEKSGERGLAVPGMPGGSPGMELKRKESYDVIAFRADGTTRVYAHV